MFRFFFHYQLHLLYLINSQSTSIYNFVIDIECRDIIFQEIKKGKFRVSMKNTFDKTKMS